MSDYRFKKGQEVIVRQDLNTATRYFMNSGERANKSNNFATDNMVLYAGKKVHISSYWSNQYLIEEDDCRHDWTDEMFEDVNCIFHGLI